MISSLKKWFINKRKPKINAEYQKFLISTKEYKRTFTKCLRPGVSFFLLITFISKLSFHETGLFELISYPIVLILNLISSTLVLSKKYEIYISAYIGSSIVALCTITLDAFELSQEEISYLTNLMTGFYTIMLFAILMVSNISSGYFFASSFVIGIETLIKLMRIGKVNSAIVTMGIESIIILIFINIAYLYKEKYDFKIWNSLQDSVNGLTKFQKLMQIFPGEILIISKESWTENRALYLNSEARKRLCTPKSNFNLRDYFKFFLLETSSNEENPFVTLQNYELTDIINSYLNENLPNAGKFKNYIGVYRPKGNSNHNNAQNILNPDFLLSNEYYSLKSEENNCAESLWFLDSVIEDGEDGLNERRRYEIKLGNIKWDGEDCLIMIMNDISQSEKIRELIAVHENKDRLLATVSHELRTPLNGIIGMLDIAEEKVDPILLEYISIARNSARALLLMINDLLDISQVSKGKLKLNYENVSLKSLIEGVIPLVKVQMEKRGLNFEYINNCPLKTQLHVDPTRFQQILLNLLTNAYKFTDFGNITLETSVDDIASDKSYDENSRHLMSDPNKADDEKIISGFVNISVEDTGKGIKSEDMAELFKLFGKIEQSGNQTGVGLGLAISQKLAQHFHPKGLKVESRYGVGTKFWFKVKISSLGLENFSEMNLKENLEPMCLPYNHTQVESLEKKVTVSDFQSKRVLVVDDDQINHIVIGKYLSFFEEIKVTKAFNGLEAVKLVESQAKIGVYFDLVLMDCNMPIMDGYTASCNIKNLVSQGVIPDLKIVAVTANVSESDRAISLASGMIDVWAKPLEQKDFQIKLKGMLLMT